MMRKKENIWEENWQATWGWNCRDIINHACVYNSTYSSQYWAMLSLNVHEIDTIFSSQNKALRQFD